MCNMSFLGECVDLLLKSWEVRRRAGDPGSSGSALIFVSNSDSFFVMEPPERGSISNSHPLRVSSFLSVNLITSVNPNCGPCPFLTSERLCLMLKGSSFCCARIAI